MAIDKIQSESINLADTFAFTGTVTGAGGTNTPFFQGRLNADQNVSSGSGTLAQFTADLDTASGWDRSNYKWVVPSGQAGKYYIGMAVNGSSSSNNSVSWCNIQIWKNSGAILWSDGKTTSGNSGDTHVLPNFVSGVFSLAVGDEVKFYATVYVTGGTPKFLGGSASPTVGTIFKIIE